MTTEKRSRMLTRKQIYAIGTELDRHCVPDPENKGFWKYRDGVSDDTLAEKYDANKQQIQAVRRELKGELKVGAHTNNGGPIALAFEKIKLLEARVTALEDQVTKPHRPSYAPSITRHNG